jgi:hypothetical protein
VHARKCGGAFGRGRSLCWCAGGRAGGRVGKARETGLEVLQINKANHPSRASQPSTPAT